MADCPCCGQAVPSTESLEISGVIEALTPTERRVAEKLIAAYPKTVHRDAIIDNMYASDPDGGPDFARQVFATTLSRLRKKLERHGWTVPRGRYMFYGISRK